MKDSYPLASILRIRCMHEERATTNVGVAKKALAAAEQECEARKRDYEEYLAWLPQEVDRRYAKLFGRIVSQEQLDAFHAGIAALREEVLRKELAIRDAEATVTKARDGVEEAREALRQARSAKSKLEEHRKRWREEERKEQERLEDLAMEDVRKPSLLSEESDLDVI